MTSADPAHLADHELESRRHRMAVSGVARLTDDKGRTWTWGDIVTEQANRAACGPPVSTDADYHEACRRLGYDPTADQFQRQRVAVWDEVDRLRRERGAGPILTSDGRTGPGCTASDAAENLPVEDDGARPWCTASGKRAMSNSANAERCPYCGNSVPLVAGIMGAEYQAHRT